METKRIEHQIYLVIIILLLAIIVYYEIDISYMKSEIRRLQVKSSILQVQIGEINEKRVRLLNKLVDSKSILSSPYKPK